MTPRDIVCEEWQRAVKEFGLKPGTPTETVTARILERLAALSPPEPTEGREWREQCAVLADTEAAEYLRQIDEHNKSSNTYRSASDIPGYIRERGIHLHAKYSASLNLAGLIRAMPLQDCAAGQIEGQALHALRELDLLIDFGEPCSEDKALIFEDWSDLNKAFELAHAVLVARRAMVAEDRVEGKS